MLRTMVSSSMLLAAVPVANATQKSGSEPIVRRPSELSIYNVEEKFDHVRFYDPIAIAQLQNNQFYLISGRRV